MFSPGTDGASYIKTDVHIFQDFQISADDCDEEMGFRSGRLPDARFTAKSVYDANPLHAQYQARLHKPVPGWCSKTYSPISDYLQIDLATIKVLRGMALQSHGTAVGYWPVLSFIIQHSIDGGQWNTYSENSTDFELRGKQSRR